MNRSQFLLIVRRGETERFRFLHESFAGEPVRIVWDRRMGDRRCRHRPVLLDRRQRRVRRRPSVVWDALGFAVAAASEVVGPEAGRPSLTNAPAPGIK